MGWTSKNIYNASLYDSCMTWPLGINRRHQINSISTIYFFNSALFTSTSSMEECPRVVRGAEWEQYPSRRLRHDWNTPRRTVRYLHVKDCAEMRCACVILYQQITRERENEDSLTQIWVYYSHNKNGLFSVTKIRVYCHKMYTNNVTWLTMMTKSTKYWCNQNSIQKRSPITAIVDDTHFWGKALSQSLVAVLHLHGVSQRTLPRREYGILLGENNNSKQYIERIGAG